MSKPTPPLQKIHPNLGTHLIFYFTFRHLIGAEEDKYKSAEW